MCSLKFYRIVADFYSLVLNREKFFALRINQTYSYKQVDFWDEDLKDRFKNLFTAQAL